MGDFQDLTAELVDDIASRLDNAALRSLHLTSRECCERSNKPFSIRICNQRYLIAEHSFDALLAISKHPKFGPSLKTLRLPLCFLDAESSYDLFGMELACAKSNAERKEIRDREKLVKKRLSKQKSFTLKKAMKMLKSILSEMQNLKAIEVGEWNCDYDRRSEERPFGVEQKDYLVTNTILKPRGYGEVQGLAFSFAVVVHALASTGKQVKRISAHCWDGVKPKTIRTMSSEDLSSMVRIHERSSRILDAFLHLRSLSLSVMFWEPTYERHSNVSKQWLADLLQYLLFLEQISLTSDGWAEFGPMSSDSESAFGAVVQRLHPSSFRHLKRLGLVHIELSKQELLDLIAKAPKTLTDITLALVKLRAGRWADFLPVLQDLGNVQRRYYLDLSWLVDRDTPNLFDLSSIVVFEEDGIDGCRRCNYRDALKVTPCAHIRYSTRGEELDRLTRVKTRSSEFFERS